MLRTLTNKFNRGEVSPRAIARQDVQKIQNSASLVENWMPIRLGPMLTRPGLEHLGSVDNGVAYFEPFVAATDDTALLEFTDGWMRVWVDDDLIIRPAVSAAVTNGDFDTDITGWTDDSSGAGSSAWETGGYAKLTGDGTSAGAIYQTITITETGTEHAVRIVIKDAPLVFALGTTVGGSEIFGGTLLPGTHSLAFTPTGNVTFHFSTKQKYRSLLDSVQIEGAVEVKFPSSIPLASLPLIRTTQSADVVFVACDGVKPQQVERRGKRSWSMVDFRADLGPFNTINITPITMQAGALSGDTTLTASDDYFRSNHVGALFKVSSTSQNVQATVTAEDNGTNAIRVAGVGSAVRRFTRIITGLSGTGSKVHLQRSTDELTWEDIESYTTDQNTTFSDGLDNAVLFYRLHVKSGNYVAGTISLTLNYPSGSIDGVCRVTSFTSATVVNVQVLEDFGSTDATRDWFEGSWSDNEGFPSAVALYEGRLWWAGKTKVWGSVSDAFNAFGGDEEGDSRTIQKTIGFGPVDAVNWLAPTSRLIIGLASDEVSIRSNSFGEVLTQNNANLKAGTNQGSAKNAPVRADSTIYFVQRSGIRLYALDYAIDTDTHQGTDVTTLNPEIMKEGVKRIGVTRQPETRVFAVLDDGSVRIHLTDRAEDVKAWSRITTDGTIEDVVTLPGEDEDRVYMVVNRTNGRYLEKLALQKDAIGESRSRHLDSHLSFTSPGTTISAPHLANETVRVWADGADRGEFTADGSGDVVVPTAWTDVVVGYGVTCDYRSNRVSEYMPDFVHNRPKRVTRIGLVMRDVYRPLLEFGSDELNLSPMPDVERGKSDPVTASDTVYDELPIEFDGVYETDPRVFLRSRGPATVLAMVYEVDDPFDTTTKAG